MKKASYSLIVIAFAVVVVALNLDIGTSAETVSYEGQEFTIIPAFEGMIDYVEQAKQADEQEWDTIFRETVADPLAIEFWGQTLPTYRNVPINTIKDIKSLEKNIVALQESNVVEVIADALVESASYLSGQDMTVYVLALDPDRRFEIDNMNGLHGISMGDGNILIQIDVNSEWEKMLPYLIAHEYHHEVFLGRTAGSDFDGTLLSRIITEGKADTFASIVYPEVTAPWTIPLTEEEEADVWRQMSILQGVSTWMTISRFQFGSEARDIPQWSGYKIGYQIMQDLLANEPDLTISEWTNMRSKDVLERSRFEERF